MYVCVTERKMERVCVCVCSSVCECERRRRNKRRCWEGIGQKQKGHAAKLHTHTFACSCRSSTMSSKVLPGRSTSILLGSTFPGRRCSSWSWFSRRMHSFLNDGVRLHVECSMTQENRATARPFLFFLTPAHTHTHTRTHAHTHYPSHTHTHSLSLSLSLSRPINPPSTRSATNNCFSTSKQAFAVVEAFVSECRGSFWPLFVCLMDGQKRKQWL